MKSGSGRQKWRHKESSWSAREKKVIANMEDYVNNHDNVQVEVEELELISKSASEHREKDDAACATTKFAFVY